jgi:hypothetical protein
MHSIMIPSASALASLTRTSEWTELVGCFRAL